MTPFKEEPGQSILQPDSDELPHFSQFADFTQISRTKFGCDILQLYTAQQWRLQHSKVSLCIKCTLSKIGCCWGADCFDFVRAEDSILDQRSGSDQSALCSRVS